MLIITVSTTNLNYTITQLLSVMQLLIPIMIIKEENENYIKESNSKLFIEKKTLFIVNIFDVNYAYRTNILLYSYRLVIVYEKQIIIQYF